MSIAAKAIGFSKGNKLDELIIQLTMSGNYTTAVGGDTLDLTKITNPSIIDYVFPLAPGKAAMLIPPGIDCEAMGGYYAQVIPGATLDVYKVAFYLSEGSELGTGAYPAAITGGTLTVRLKYSDLG